jgi:hypothetical protein
MDLKNKKNKKPKTLNIWIDITNSPHVLFFRPIIKQLKKRGHKVTVTYRDFAQTKDLIKKFNIKAQLFGKYGGKSIFNKVCALISRSFKLFKFAKHKNFDLALSHNSVDICVVSKLLGIKCIDIFDYEFAQFHHINVRCSNIIMCPKYIKLKDLKKYGCKKNKLISVPFLKEQMYLSDYNFNNNILKKLNLDSKKVIIVFRPPAEMSLYHKGIKNNLYKKLLFYLKNKNNIQVVFLPRTDEQKEYICSKNYSNFIIPKKAIDAPSLIKKSDIVISAGGTMNREAAVLGTPVYTSLALRLGGVDKYLIKKKLLIKLNKVSDLKINKKKRSKGLKFISCNYFVDFFESI